MRTRCSSIPQAMHATLYVVLWTALVGCSGPTVEIRSNALVTIASKSVAVPWETPTATPAPTAEPTASPEVTPAATPVTASHNPTLGFIGTQTTSEDSAKVVSIIASDTNVPLSCSDSNLFYTSSNPEVVASSNAISWGGVWPSCTATINPVANASGNADITITISDGLLTVARTFTLVVVPADDAPTISDVPNQTTNQNVSLNNIAVTIDDVDSALTCSALIASSSNVTLLPNSNISFSGTYPNCKVNLTPAPNQNGGTTVTLTVSDGTSRAQDTFTFTVVAGNGAPTLASIGPQVTNEDTTKVVTLSPTYANEPLSCSASNLLYTSSNPSIVASANAVSWDGVWPACIATVNPVPNANGSSNITIIISDGLLTASQTFTLTVAAVSDAPTISDVLNQSTNEDVALNNIAVTIGDVDAALTCGALTGTSSNTTLLPNANVAVSGTYPNCKVNLTPAANQNGSATVTLTVNDGSLTAQDTFTFTVTAVNDAPTISNVPDQSTSEDVALSNIAVSIGDIDSVLTCSALTGASSNTTVLPSANIVVSGIYPNCKLGLTPALNQSGSANVTLTVSDGLLSTQGSFALTVATTTPTLSQLATPANRSPGAPKYEDIIASPRQFDWPKAQGRDVLKDIKTFHATRLDWMYIQDGDQQIVSDLQKDGLTIGLALTHPRDTTARITGAVGFGARPYLYTLGRILDINGNVLDGRSSMHDPATEQVVKTWLQMFAQFKPVSIQRDEPDWGYTSWDFNPYALSQFNEYLATRVPQTTLDTLQITSPTTFDLKAYIGAHNNGASVPSAFKTLWQNFRQETLVSFFAKMKLWTKDLVGPDVEWSTNYSSFVSFTPIQLWSDFAISELQPSGGQFGIGNPWSLYKKITLARGLGKSIVVTLGSHNVRENKVMIGLTYAMGAHMLCPYGVYMKDAPRLFGDPAIYSDAYDFVDRWGKTFLAGYEEVLAIGNGIVPAASNLPPPVRLEDPSSSVYAFVRAKPGQADAPVVVHLVNWGTTTNQPLAVTLEPQRFFPGRGLKISLLRPGAEPTILSDGFQTRVDVPVPDYWSILVVEPSTAVANIPWAPEVTTESLEFFDSRSVVLRSRTPGSNIRYTLDGTTPTESSPSYVQPIVVSSSGSLKARAFVDGTGSPVSEFALTKLPSNALPQSVATLNQGLTYELRKGIQISTGADLDDPMKWAGATYQFTSSATGVIANLGLPSSATGSMFAVSLHGLIDVPQDGLYTFYMSADDECRFSIDQGVLINQTGRKVPPDLGMMEHSGTRLLSKGLHSIDVEFLQMYSSFGLKIQWEGPGLPRQDIAKEALKYSPP
jgi:hypothetical protein